MSSHMPVPAFSTCEHTGCFMGEWEGEGEGGEGEKGYVFCLDQCRSYIFMSCTSHGLGYVHA